MVIKCNFCFLCFAWFCFGLIWWRRIIIKRSAEAIERNRSVFWLLQLWFGVSSGSRSAGCSNFCSHFRLNLILWKDEWSVTVFICLRLSCICSVEVSEHWPIEKVNVIKHGLSGFIQYSTTVVVLIAIFSVNSKRSECQYGAKEPQEQPLQLSVSVDANRTFRHAVMKMIHTQGPRVSIVQWLHGRNYIISAGLL